MLDEVLERLPEAPARPGARELVEGVVATGKRVALVSNSSHQVIDVTLASFPWAELLETRISVDDVSRGKPHPDIYEYAAGRLSLRPEQCLVIEDSVAGATAAVGSGARCIAVTFGLVPERFDGVTDRVADSLAEVAELLLH